MAEGDQPEPRGAAQRPGATPRAGTVSRAFRLTGLLLLDNLGNRPIHVDSLSFADDGIGVTRSPGEPARVLPWSSVIGCVVERWNGGVIPEWWVDPELHDRREPAAGAITDPGATTRPLPHAEPGAVIGVQTPNGTFRFLVTDGDPIDLTHRINALALRHRGSQAVSSVTRVVAWGEDVERRKSVRPAPVATGWGRLRPYVVVALIVLAALMAALILLQSAGTIHLPLLGGPGSGPGALVSTR